MNIAKFLAALLFVGVALALAANEYYVSRAQARLAAALAPARAANAPMTVVALDQPNPPDEQNAVVVLKRVEADLKKLHAQLTAVLPQDWPENHEVPWTDKQMAAVEDLFARHTDILKALHQAANCPASDQLLDFHLPAQDIIRDTLPGMENPRVAVRVLDIHADMLRRTKQWEPAFIDVAAMLNLARHLEDEPMIVNGLGAVAQRTMAFNSLRRLLEENDVQLTAWAPVERAVLRNDDPRRFEWTLASERVLQMATIDEMHPRGFRWLGRGWRFNEQAGCAETIQYYLTAAAAPNPGAFIGNAPNPGGLAAVAAPAMDAAFAAHCGDLARIRVVQVALRIAQSRGGTQTQVAFHGPEPLTDAEEATTATTVYLSDQWRDPFDGQPLRVRRDTAGWVIYSIGKNLTDDSGNFADDADIGLGPFLPVPFVPPAPPQN